MIKYAPATFHPILLFAYTGSVFPFAFAVALPCAAFSAAMKFLVAHEVGDSAEFFERILLDNAAYTAFTFLAGFLIVFRTSQAYGRFWEGVDAIKVMQSEWLSATNTLVAFCRYSKVDEVLVIEFQHMLVRLVSMLHACALAQLEENDDDELPHAFTFELIDARGVDKESLETLRTEAHKVELIVQWLQSMVVDGMLTGVLSIPPPLLSVVFSSFSDGLRSFYDAYKIAEVPYPFPYMQTTELLLVAHWLVTPMVICNFTYTPLWSGVFSFLATFILWSLNAIAGELENPFGQDPNDFDGKEMQHSLNQRLLLLLRSSTLKRPRLSEEATLEESSLTDESSSMLSFQDVWESLLSEVKVGRVSAHSRKISLAGWDVAKRDSMEPMRRVPKILKGLGTSLTEIDQETDTSSPKNFPDVAMRSTANMSGRFSSVDSSVCRPAAPREDAKAAALDKSCSGWESACSSVAENGVAEHVLESEQIGEENVNPVPVQQVHMSPSANLLVWC